MLFESGIAKMYIVKSRVTLKKNKRSITNILRKERKWNDLKCLIISIKGRKRVEDKDKNKEQG